jgi:hypothetical protein
VNSALGSRAVVDTVHPRGQPADTSSRVIRSACGVGTGPLAMLPKVSGHDAATQRGTPEEQVTGQEQQLDQDEDQDGVGGPAGPLRVSQRRAADTEVHRDDQCPACQQAQGGSSRTASPARAGAWPSASSPPSRNALQRPVAQALAKEPDDRPTAAELRDACTALLAAQATAATQRDQEQPTLVSDLVSAHWDLPPENDAAWPTAARSRRVKLLTTVVAAAAVVGGIGGAIAASSASKPEHRQETALPSSQTKTVRAPATAEPTRSEKTRGTASPTLSLATPSVISAETRTPSPASPSPLQPPPFTYLPDQLDCTPRKEAEVDGSW